MTPKEYRTALAESFVNVLSEKGLEWKKGWQGFGTDTPMNGVTKYKYKGINRFSLSLISMMRGYEDPRWCTFNQIKKADWKLVNATGQGVKVEYWFPYHLKEEKSLTWKEYNALEKEEQDKCSIRSIFKTVFNASLIEGIEPLPEPEKRDITPDAIVDTLSKNMQVPIIHDGGDRAFYRPSEDAIHLPQPEYFNNDYEYGATALHELAHSTGAEHRLNRGFGARGTDAYAFEELVAEISSCFVGMNLKSEQSAEHIENHKAYVQAWVQKIKENPDVLVKAIQEAEKASAYMEYHAGMIPKDEYELTAGASKEVLAAQPTPTLQETDNMSLEERYTKAFALAGYERVAEPQDSMETVAFHNPDDNFTYRGDSIESLRFDIEMLQPKNSADTALFEEYIHPKDRVRYYTESEGADAKPKEYLDLQSALKDYLAHEEEGKKLGVLFNGTKTELATFNPITMKHSWKASEMTWTDKNFEEMTLNEITELQSDLSKLEKPLKEDNLYYQLRKSFDEIEAVALHEIMINRSEWGSWLGHCANRSRPQDYIAIDITGYSAKHEIRVKLDVIQGNVLSDSAIFQSKIDTGYFDQGVIDAFADLREQAYLYLKTAVGKLMTDATSPMITYSRYTENSLNDHYDFLAMEGY
ncbi:MAG: zincin-like metallopeptidase domain-containing protein, partial [Eubacteriales bacterium]|nr:zincin-like metallopeptidase domain-containing protein [Eubacteriales bacterium]